MGKRTERGGGKYQMTISRLTVDKLGVKLYDRVSAVIAEIVANSYDADAKEVVVSAPMGEYLATKAAGVFTGQRLLRRGQGQRHRHDSR